MSIFKKESSKTTIMAFTWATMKNLFSKPVTKNYPAVPAVYPERSRGHIEIEIEKCISCSICAKNCPPGCLSVDRKKGTWTINRFDCIACGYCTTKCPKNCLHLAPGYQTPMPEKSSETFTRPNMPDPADAAKAAAAKKAAALKAAKAKAAAVKPEEGAVKAKAAAVKPEEGTVKAKAAAAKPEEGAVKAKAAAAKVEEGAVKAKAAAVKVEESAVGDSGRKGEE